MPEGVLFLADNNKARLDAAVKEVDSLDGRYLVHHNTSVYVINVFSSFRIAVVISSYVTTLVYSLAFSFYFCPMHFNFKNCKIGGDYSVV